MDSHYRRGRGDGLGVVVYIERSLGQGIERTAHGYSDGQVDQWPGTEPGTAFNYNLMFYSDT